MAAPSFEMFSIVVRDMEAAVRFYSVLGFEVRVGHPDWDRHHRTLVTTGGAQIDLDSEAFAHEWDSGCPGRAASGCGGVLGLRVESREAVDELFQKVLDAGYLAQQQPYDAFWGARYAIVEDPDGNAIGIMSPVDPSRASRPRLPGAADG